MGSSGHHYIRVWSVPNARESTLSSMVGFTVIQPLFLASALGVPLGASRKHWVDVSAREYVRPHRRHCPHALIAVFGNELTLGIIDASNGLVIYAIRLLVQNVVQIGRNVTGFYSRRSSSGDAETSLLAPARAPVSLLLVVTVLRASNDS